VEEIDLARLASRGVLTHAAADSRLANELRVIKRPLLNNCIGKSAGRIKHANRIMITSALPGEGKSFIAVNLAMSIAMERDSTVLLVEADTGRSSLANLLGIPAGKGLMDVLAQPGTDVGEVPEARVLARYMGQIVLVVEAEGVTHGTVLQALSTVENCPVVMTVLNKVSTLEDKFYYYSG
jgi:Mrp family chromosome partitioning ATPase